MRSRLAIVVAAAVIFAPGWYGQAPPQQPHAGDLVARVLAPTLDEAAMRNGDAKHQLSLRQLKRWRPSFASVPAVALFLGSTALVVYWIVALYRARLFFACRFSNRLSRAPPAIQPA
jgi:hypothetical protein